MSGAHAAQHMIDRDSNLIIVRGHVKRSIPPNQVNVGKDFINMDFAESQMKMADNQLQYNYMIPKMYKDRQGISHKIKQLGQPHQQQVTHQSVLIAQRMSEKNHMDVTGTKLISVSNMSKICDSSEAPLSFINQNK